MKTELEIAKENIARYNFNKAKQYAEDMITNITQNEEHKATCQRWLEFLESKQLYISSFKDDVTNGFGQSDYNLDLGSKIKDLKQAIALYEKEGI